MIAQIDIRDIPPSNIIISFLSLDKLIMFSNDMNSSRMRSNRTSTSYQSKQKSTTTPKMIDKVVSEDNEDVICDLVQSYTGIVHEDRTESVENLYYEVEEVFVPFVLIGKF